MTSIAVRLGAVAGLLAATQAVFGQFVDGKPTASEIAENYARSARLGREFAGKALNLRLVPTWLDQGKQFTYRREVVGGSEIVLVQTDTGVTRLAFDHVKVAAALSTAMGKTIEPRQLPPLRSWSPTTASFDQDGKRWTVDLSSFKVESSTAPNPPRRPNPAPWRQNLWEPDLRPKASPDKRWTARIVGENVVVRKGDGNETQLSVSGSPAAYFARIEWSPDSKVLVATRVLPGDRKKVFLLESSAADTTRAVLLERVYDQPGDRVDTFDTWILDPAAQTERRVATEPVDYGSLPDYRWDLDGLHFRYDKMDRGYGRWRMIRVDPATATAATILDDDPATFVDSTSLFVYSCQQSNDIVWRSERDGWGHLYLSSGDGKTTTQITQGNWVVRSVVNVDEAKRQITFVASGMTPGEDPYFTHVYRVDFDGKHLTSLTPAIGNHTVEFSPDRSVLIDTYSTVDTAPVHELRRASDGQLLATLERSSTSALIAAGWKAPKPFVAKGRDGATDIYGVIYFPTNFDPSRKYPIIEDIYAGPHDSFTPKSFATFRGDQALAELGFIVVQCDGMGTRNRGKAFQDVCYQNLADAGFPDRIAWIKAAATAFPQMDITRVGIFGTSAGGQSSTGALLFHPEFYKVAVSSCGCHDNRIDKIWWNEQWMGLIGPHYAAQSNITHAANLEGKLLLMVGELDTNVPPESTYRLLDAFQKANRDVDFVMLPGSDHTAGGTYGERKRRDFFVRHLLGVEPPNWKL